MALLAAVHSARPRAQTLSLPTLIHFAFVILWSEAHIVRMAIIILPSEGHRMTICQ